MTRKPPAAAIARSVPARVRSRRAAASAPHASPRRGVTLVEMLVTIALLVLVMSILAGVFSSATSAISSQRVFAGLDQDLRRIESRLRLDLEGRGGVGGITAKMDPSSGGARIEENRGYFEYGENALADIQGEDTDDYIAFTATSPPDQPFTGTAAVAVFNGGTLVGYNRVPITSTTAEIVYFLRNGNLYRRVFLIISDSRKSSPAFAAVGMRDNGTMTPGGGYRLLGSFNSLGTTTGVVSRLYEMPVSWAGFNDISARPSAFPVAPVPFGTGRTYPSIDDGPTAGLGRFEAATTYRPIFNTLGDLTDRHNRVFKPRFVENNDFVETIDPTAYRNVPDGLPDDTDNDGIFDYHPNLYPQAYANANLGGRVLISPPAGVAGLTADIHAERLKFPYIYPNAYSQADGATAADYGAIHSLDPGLATTNTALANSPRIFNHAPQASGDPLGTPSAPQTWWGFPTKKEQMSSPWTDPVKRMNDPASPFFPTFARPDGDPTGGEGQLKFFADIDSHVDTYDPIAAETPATQSRGLRLATGPAVAPVLPPMTEPLRGPLGAQPFNDGAGNLGWLHTTAEPTAPFDSDTWQALPEEDLILSGVRSFDVKALEVVNYEPDPAQTGLPALPPATRYVDLGYGNFYDGTPPRLNSGIDFDNNGSVDYYVVTLKTFAHEGRIPSLFADFRSDAQWPTIRQNIGDDTTGVIRLRRVWDSWSQTYSRANPPDTPINPAMRPPFAPPPLVSYPAPYPAALRGIQVQLRVVDPKNQHVKLLTLRFDFANNLN